MLAKRIPGLAFAYRKVTAMLGVGAGRRHIRRVFGEIFQKNAWGSPVSLSGSGSSLEQTSVVRAELPALCAEFGVSRLLDIPCGDFHWMQHTNLAGITYWGADVVDALIQGNSRRYTDSAAERNFLVLDLCSDPLPEVELILCRDCLVHLSTSDIFRALANVSRSKAKYFLTTTFTERTDNPDIVTGGWRPVNLCLGPFSLPAPIRVFNERCTEDDNRYGDKSLGLWRISDIASVLQARGNQFA